MTVVINNLAHYQCQKRKYDWEQKPDQVICKMCGNLYITWLNYDKWFK